jgi:hypothetical protein
VVLLLKQIATRPAGQAQRFLGAHAAVYNLFDLGRHLVRAEHYRNLRETRAEYLRGDVVDSMP